MNALLVWKMSFQGTKKLKKTSGRLRMYLRENRSHLYLDIDEEKMNHLKRKKEGETKQQRKGTKQQNYHKHVFKGFISQKGFLFSVAPGCKKTVGFIASIESTNIKSTPLDHFKLNVRATLYSSKLAKRNITKGRKWAMCNLNKDNTITLTWQLSIQVARAIGLAFGVGFRGHLVASTRTEAMTVIVAESRNSIEQVKSYCIAHSSQDPAVPPRDWMPEMHT